MINSKRQMVFIRIIILLAFIYMTLPYPVLVPMFIKNHVSMFFLGLVLGSYPLGMFFGAPILGALSDVIGRKSIFLVSFLGASISFFCSGLCVAYHVLNVLIFTRFISGVFEANVAIARASAADISDDINDKQKNFGAVNAALTSGWLIGPVLGGVFSNHHLVSWFNYSTPFFLSSTLSLLALLSICFCFQDLPSNSIKASCRYKKIAFIKYRNFRDILKNRKLSSAFIVGFFITLSVDFFYQFLPVYLVGKWSFTPMFLAFAVGLIAIGNIITNNFVLHKLSRILSIETTIRYATVLFSFLLVSIVLSWKPYYVMSILPLIGALIALSPTNMSVLISSAAHEKQQGHVMGVMTSTRVFGNALMCIFGGLIASYQLSLPIFVSSFFGILAVTLFTILIRSNG